MPDGGISGSEIKRIRHEFGESAFLGAIAESFDLLQICQAFGAGEINKALLRKISGGSFSELFENKYKPATSVGRNYLFELSVAAIFRRRGFRVRIGEDADGVFDFENHRVFIECKRLLSDKRFEHNLCKAEDQLVSRFESFGLPVNLVGQIPAGISMFSVGKILNPELDFLSGPSSTAISITANELQDQLWNRIQALSKVRSHENSIITGFQFRTPVIIGGIFGVYRRWKFYARHTQGHPRFQVMQAITDRLSPDPLRKST